MARHLTAEPRHTATIAANVLDAVAEEFETDNVEWIPVATLRNIARRLRNTKETA
jgi:hypothetical protein